MSKAKEYPVPEAPKGLNILKWVGPGIIWSVSAIATGELLFTPRVAAQYGYTVLWVLFLGIFLKALIAREIGRFAVVTGGSLLYGIRDLPGPRNWGIWLIIVPQLFVAVATTAGIIGATASAIILVVPLPFVLLGLIALAVSVTLVYLGRYTAVERVSTVVSVATTVGLIITASAVFPPPGELAAGLIPQFPPNVDFNEILPWLGLMMSGAAGLMWYSHWLVARGYGSAGAEEVRDDAPLEVAELNSMERSRLKRWLRTMTIVTAVAVLAVLLLMISLMILGTELLMPLGLVPEGQEITEVLSRLLGEVWGPVGAWALILAAFFSFWSTSIANLDGWGRMLTEGSLFIKEQTAPRSKLGTQFFRNLYLLGLMGVLPAVLFALNPQPVTFLIIAGIIEVVHTPIVAFFTLRLNRRTLPPELRPSVITNVLMFSAATFFTGFAAYYIYLELLT